MGDITAGDTSQNDRPHVCGAEIHADDRDPTQEALRDLDATTNRAHRPECSPASDQANQLTAMPVLPKIQRDSHPLPTPLPRTSRCAPDTDREHTPGRTEHREATIHPKVPAAPLSIRRGNGAPTPSIRGRAPRATSRGRVKQTALCRDPHQRCKVPLFIY